LNLSMGSGRMVLLPRLEQAGFHLVERTLHSLLAFGLYLDLGLGRVLDVLCWQGRHQPGVGSSTAGTWQGGNPGEVVGQHGVLRYIQ